MRRDKQVKLDKANRQIQHERILLLAIETFGDRDRALEWMHRTNRALLGHTPMELLNTDSGVRVVEQILERIAHGVFS